ncbi:hypothetical protein FRC03_011776 [Tulasnella sp. 419]|nr:hypothetical protein FRC02_008097 [Tulasnella sp. 418]KAG8953388.1 hypothetical protein FRC03_011776 [Tulasnella sp. 419]
MASTHRPRASAASCASAYTCPEADTTTFPLRTGIARPSTLPAGLFCNYGSQNDPIDSWACIYDSNTGKLIFSNDTPTGPDGKFDACYATANQCFNSVPIRKRGGHRASTIQYKRAV